MIARLHQMTHRWRAGWWQHLRASSQLSRQHAGSCLLGALDSSHPQPGYHMHPAAADACLHLSAVRADGRPFVPSAADCYCVPSSRPSSSPGSTSSWTAALNEGASAESIVGSMCWLPSGVTGGTATDQLQDDTLYKMCVKGLVSVAVSSPEPMQPRPTDQVLP